MEKSKGGLGSFIIKLILLLIAVGFILSSIVGSGFLTGGGQPLGRDVRIQIGEEALTDGMIQRAVQDYLVSTNQSQITQNQLQMIQNNLIEQLLLAQAYNQFGGVKPPKESVAYVVTQNPLFDVNGKYDNQLYRTYLEDRHYTPDQYVNERVMPEIKSQVIMKGLIGSDFILPSDSHFLAQLIGQKREIKTATLNLDAIVFPKNVKVKEGAAQSYYETHLDEFYQNPEYKLNYIALSFEKLKEATPADSIPQEAVKIYYDEHLDQFTTPAKYNFHIIVAKDTESAEIITEKLQAGKAFDAVAKTNSLQPDLLDMGWFTEPEIETSFPEYASLQTVGQYLEFPQSNGTVYIIELSAMTPETIAQYSQVENDIHQYLLNESVLDAYRLQVEQLEALSPEQYGSLNSLVEASHLPLKVDHSDWNTSDETLFKKPEIAQALQESDLLNNEGSTHKLSQIIYTNQGAEVYVIQVGDYKPARTLSFDEVQSKIMEKLKQEEMQSLFAKHVQEMTDELNQGEQFKSLNFDSNYTVTRQSALPSEKIVELAYQLESSKNQPIYGSVLTSPTQATFVKLVSEQQETLTAEELAILNSQLEMIYQQKFMELLYQDILNKTPAMTGQPQNEAQN